MLNVRLWSLVLATGALIASASPSQAQNPNFRINPNLAFNQAAYNANVFGIANTTPILGNPLLNTNPYLSGYSPFAGYGASTLTSIGRDPNYDNTGYSGSGYGNPYLAIPDPYRGYFTGAADLTTAQGKFHINWQQARLLNQQVEQSKIDTRRKLMEEWRYIRANMPTAEDMRLQTRDRELTRARKDPPFVDILSARALNNLMDHFKEMQAKGTVGPDVTLDPEMLQSINVVSDTAATLVCSDPRKR